MKRLLLAALAVAGLASCSIIQGVKSDPVGTALKAGEDTVAAKKDAEKACAPLLVDKVPYVEERSLGGSISVAAALKLAPIRINATSVTAQQALEHPENLSYDKEATLNQMTAALAALGTRLGASSSRPELFWTFSVLDSPSVNAFSAPGGYVFVTTGLLQKVKTEDALAGVLAHEITHVTNRDAIHSYLVAKEWGCETVFLAKKGASAVAAEALSQMGVNADAAFAAYDAALKDPNHKVDYDAESNHPLVKLIVGHMMDTVGSGIARKQEIAADVGAVELMTSATFDAKPFISLVKSLGDAPGVFPNHPSAQDRVKAMEAELTTLSDAKAHPFIDWAKIKKRHDVKLASAITRGLAGSAVASDPASER
jgi:predicted Zn-dependent protease